MKTAKHLLKQMLQGKTFAPVKPRILYLSDTPTPGLETKIASLPTYDGWTVIDLGTGTKPENA